MTSTLEYSNTKLEPYSTTDMKSVIPIKNSRPNTYDDRATCCQTQSGILGVQVRSVSLLTHVYDPHYIVPAEVAPEGVTSVVFDNLKLADGPGPTWTKG
jgi:hypothetical protein